MVVFYANNERGPEGRTLPEVRKKNTYLSDAERTWYLTQTKAILEGAQRRYLAQAVKT